MHPTVQYTQSCHRKLICLSFFFAVQESWRQRFQQEDEGEALAKVLECCALEVQKDNSCSRQDTSSSQPLDENTVKQNKTKKERKINK